MHHMAGSGSGLVLLIVFGVLFLIALTSSPSKNL
jgi:hypothetical protein